MKGVAHSRSDEPTVNYQLNLQLIVELLVHSHGSHSVVFGPSRLLFSEKLHTTDRTDSVGD